LLAASSLSLTYRRRSVLERVTLTFAAGTTALLGLNGAGKTTLLRALGGAHRPAAGEVRIQGDDPYDRAARSRALARVALVPQFLEFPRHLRVVDFLDYMALIRGVPPARRKAASCSALAAVDLTERSATKLGALSGGMLKRLSIAQALLAAPAILLCDEPTVGLDPDQRASIRALMRRLAADRCVVIASHIVEDAQYLADRVVVLHDKGVAFDGSTTGLVSSLDLLGDNPAEGSRLEQAFLGIVRGVRP
jgi:ABC-2 type transport system ATP-binding protein